MSKRHPTTLDAAALDLRAVATYLENQAGLVFDAGRLAGLADVVAQRLDATQSGEVANYLAFVATDEGARERQVLLDAVTIKETYFFRNSPQMAALRHIVIPELVRNASAQRRPLRIWSAGCSTGEEPYTLAMLVLDTMEQRGLFVDTQIVGTDVSAAAITHGRAATYRGRTLDMAEEGARERWFVDAGQGDRTVHPDVRALVDLRVHNLVTDPQPFDEGTVDLVVCRNVTIYFAKPTTGRIMERFHEVLMPQGHLLLGHAETLWQVSDDFDLFPLGEAFVYRKADLAERARATAQAARQVHTTVREPAKPSVRAPRRVRPQRGVTAADGGATVVRIRPAAGGSGVAEVEQAQVALDAGGYEEALRCAREALTRDPLLADAYAIAGRACVALGDDPGAMDFLRKAVFLQSGCAEVHFTLAGVLQRMGQHQASANAYRAAGAAVTTTDARRLQRMLDGRDPASLAALCEQLAGSAEVSADHGQGGQACM